MELYYGGKSGCPLHGGFVNLVADDFNMPRFGLTDSQIQKVAGQIKQNPGTLVNEEIYNYTRQTLQKGIARVYGRLPHDHPHFEKAHLMQENLARFAGYKTAWQTDAIKQGKDMHAVDARFNVNWLRTEYVHTVRAARAAQQWHTIEADKDLYPYLEYMPSTAAEPRNEHKKLYGIIKPVDDPFWDTWMPPNDWGCRCSVKQVRADINARPVPEKIKPPPASMRSNPGRSGRIITDRHPMIANIPKEAQKRVNNEYLHLNRKAVRQEVMQYATQNLIGKSFLSHDGRLIGLSKGGVNKILSQRTDEIILKNKLIYDSPDIIRKMQYENPETPTGERITNVVQSHVYRYNFNKLRLRIIVWELKGKTPNYLLHAMNIL
ncbi:MAG TPA: phage minor head protein [Dissulfurispiraceae bacterium]|nr:phage minor head protein [Dissulfurispiraceae bacterium]